MGIMGLGVWMTSARAIGYVFSSVLLPPLLVPRLLLLQRLARSADTLLGYRKRNRLFRTTRPVLAHGTPGAPLSSATAHCDVHAVLVPLGRGFWAITGPRARQVDLTLIAGWVRQRMYVRPSAVLVGRLIVGRNEWTSLTRAQLARLRSRCIR